MFSQRRRTLLPLIVYSKYELAKRAFDSGDHKAAAAGFTDVLIVLADPDLAGPASQQPLADLRVLAAGFSELSRRPSPYNRGWRRSPRRCLRRQPLPLPGCRLSTTAPIWTSHRPVAVTQNIPRFSRPVLVERKGTLFVTIDETGRVESAIITEPTDRAYDQMLLTAAQKWTYRPATRDGVPVKYQKRILVTLPRQGN